MNEGEILTGFEEDLLNWERERDREKKMKETHGMNCMLINVAEASAIIPNAPVERTMVASSLEGLEAEVSARSTIFTWIIRSGKQVVGSRALMHCTEYSLPQASPLSHISSPADPNSSLDGNCASSLPWQAVAVK